MKKRKWLAGIVLSFSMIASGFAPSSTSAATDDDLNHAKMMKENIVTFMEEHKKAVDEAVDNGEKLYTFDDILKLNHNEIGIEKKELDAIKASIKESKKTLAQMEKENKNDLDVINQIKLYKERKYAKSEIMLPASEKEKVAEGQVAGGGWPNCNDDNGFGPGYFIGSDCDFGLLKYCFKDIWGKMTGDLDVRRCKPWLPRNCSPDIGHSKYHHHHWNTWPHSSH